METLLFGHINLTRKEEGSRLLNQLSKVVFHVPSGPWKFHESFCFNILHGSLLLLTGKTNLNPLIEVKDGQG